MNEIVRNTIIKEAVDSRTDDIIQRMDEFFGVAGVKEAFERNQIGKSQLSDLLRSARQASSVQEIKLYISYKEAKSKNKKRRSDWALSCGGRGSIAKNLIYSIEDIESMGKFMLEENDDIGVGLGKFNLMLVEKFLGYLYWKGTTLVSGR